MREVLSGRGLREKTQTPFIPYRGRCSDLEKKRKLLLYPIEYQRQGEGGWLQKCPSHSETAPKANCSLVQIAKSIITDMT